MISCSSSSDDLGLELNPGQSGVDVLFTEFDLPVTTYFIDSTRTDLGSNILLGGHEDEIYGSVQSTAYAEIRYSGGPLPADSLDTVTGILSLPISDKLSSSPNFDLEVEVRILADTIFSSVVYLADDEIPTIDRLVDTWSLNVEQNDSVLSVILDDQLREFIWRSSFDAESGNDIRVGVQLASKTSEGMVALDIFDEDAEIQIITRDAVDSSFTSTFIIRNHFHNISQDRSQSVLAGLESTGDTLTGVNLSYINLLAGAYTKVDLGPYLRFVEESGNIVINKADLDIPLAETSLNANSDEVDAFYFYFFKDGSVINGPGIVESLSTTLLLVDLEYADFAPMRAIRQIQLDEESSAYEETITLFAQRLLENHRNDEDYLADGLVTVPITPLSLEQTAILKDGVKLRIFYTTTN